MSLIKSKLVMLFQFIIKNKRNNLYNYKAQKLKIKKTAKLAEI